MMNLTNVRGSDAEKMCIEIVDRAKLRYLENFLRYSVKTEQGANS